MAGRDRRSIGILLDECRLGSGRVHRRISFTCYRSTLRMDTMALIERKGIPETTRHAAHASHGACGGEEKKQG